MSIWLLHNKKWIVIITLSNYRIITLHSLRWNLKHGEADFRSILWTFPLPFHPKEEEVGKKFSPRKKFDAQECPPFRICSRHTFRNCLTRHSFLKVSSIWLKEEGRDSFQKGLFFFHGFSWCSIVGWTG